MSSSPPPAVMAEQTAAREAPLALHAAESGAGGAAPASDEEADGEEGDAMDEDGGGGSHDDDMEFVGEEQDEEDDITGDISGEEQFAAQKEELLAFATMLEDNEKKAAADGDGEGTETEAASCCICMKPWTSDGAHRICCIPCGHVHGRSCLVKWLRRRGGTTAKCPQCGEMFGRQSIINLYAPEDLWNEGIRDKKQARLVAYMARMVVQTAEMGRKVHSRVSESSRMARSMARRSARDKKWLAEMSEFRGEVTSLMEKMNSMMNNSNGGDGPAGLTPDQMLEFLSRSWPKLPRPHP